MLEEYHTKIMFRDVTTTLSYKEILLPLEGSELY